MEARGEKMKRFASLLVGALALATPPRAVAEKAMDLARAESRWVSVQVTTSLPGQDPQRLSDAVRAWYAPVRGTSRRTVRVPGALVERSLLAERQPVAGSFSDFVWVFEAATGHVLSASFAGRIDEPVRIGPFRSSARVSIVTHLSTRVMGGYRVVRQIAGHTILGFCRASRDAACVPVTGAAYDRSSGWVRANGAVCASWRSLRTLAYTSLGHARFRELQPGDERTGAPPPRPKRPAGPNATPLAC